MRRCKPRWSSLAKNSRDFDAREKKLDGFFARTGDKAPPNKNTDESSQLRKQLLLYFQE
jgi:hypothetical protein